MKIPYQEGINAIPESLAIHRGRPEMSYNSYIVKLLRIALEKNYFDFSGRHFHQIAGTVMGTVLASCCSMLEF